MTFQPVVSIAGPDHVLNPSTQGYIIFAEWHFHDEGVLRSTHQILDGAFTKKEANQKQKIWSEAIN